MCLRTFKVTNVILSLLKQLQVKGLHFQVSERNRKLLHSFFWEFVQSPRARILAQSAHISLSVVGPTQQHEEEAGERNPLLLKFIFMASAVPPQLTTWRCDVRRPPQLGSCTPFRACWRGSRLVRAAPPESVGTRKLTSSQWGGWQTALRTRWWWAFSSQRDQTRDF